jgi:PhnB protein
VVHDVKQELAFLRTVFDAEILGEQPGEQGEIHHGAARIGDTVIMLVKAPQEPATGQGRIYVWSDSVDATYQRALDAGATGISGPEKRDYGTVEATIRDPQGNTWLLGEAPGKMPAKQVERRLMEQRKSRL